MSCLLLQKQPGRHTSQNPKTRSTLVKKQNRPTATATNPETDMVTRTEGLMAWGVFKGQNQDQGVSGGAFMCMYELKRSKWRRNES